MPNLPIVPSPAPAAGTVNLGDALQEGASHEPDVLGECLGPFNLAPHVATAGHVWSSLPAGTPTTATPPTCHPHVTIPQNASSPRPPVY